MPKRPKPKTISRQESLYVSMGLRRLGLSTLRQYYKTTHWRALRGAHRKKRCDQCGKGGRMALHHRTYLRLGRELVSDLETLCNACHRMEHNIPPRKSRPRKGGKKR